MDAGARIEVLEEADRLKLRVVRSVVAADVTGMAGMVKAPARGVPRSLEDFDPAALLTRPRGAKSDKLLAACRTFLASAPEVLLAHGFDDSLELIWHFSLR